MIERPRIVAPDTSHWANWIDAALGGDPTARRSARGLHGRLLQEGRVPFLSWHNLEELLVVDEPMNASARVSFLQSLPLIAWMQGPRGIGPGGIVHILAAEAIAFDAGCRALIEIRDNVRTRLLRTGVGSDAIGRDNWVWDKARHVMRERRPHMGMVSALSGLKTMDDRQTVGALSKQAIRPPAERRRKLAEIHREAFERAKVSDPKRSDDEALAMADGFLRRVEAEFPKSDVPIRRLLVETYVRPHCRRASRMDEPPFSGAALVKPGRISIVLRRLDGIDEIRGSHYADFPAAADAMFRLALSIANGEDGIAEGGETSIILLVEHSTILVMTVTSGRSLYGAD